MAGNLLDLAKSMERKRKAVEKAGSELAVDCALTAVGHLAYHTPVDTSQALSSWVTTLDAPSSAKLTPHFAGKFGSTLRASAAETLRRAKEVLKNKKPGQVIYITNNQPYIRKLNDGTHSKQPGGFVEAALLLMRRTVKKFKFKG